MISGHSTPEEWKAECDNEYIESNESKERTGGHNMTPEEAKKAYINDPKFRALVKTMADLLDKDEWKLDRLQGAQTIAASIYMTRLGNRIKDSIGRRVVDIASVVDLDGIVFAVDLKPGGKLSFTELYVSDGDTPRTKTMSPEILKYAIETEKLYLVIAYRD